MARFAVLFHAATDHPHGWVHQGPVVPDTLRRQLLCDTSGSIIGLRRGRPVDVGRRQRIVPITLRRLVEDRDRGCRVPGCTNRRVEVHHIHHWEDGGPTAAHNLICLCHRHHRMHHRGLLGITGNPESADGLIITDRHGRTLTCLPPEPAERADPIPVIGSWSHPTGERLHSHWIHFNARTQPAPARPG